MAAYVVLEIEVLDKERFEKYKQLASGAIGPYGGRYIVRGGALETLEGGWAPKRLVILEFPTVERAKAWWNSPEYAEAKAIRDACARSKTVVIEGT